MLVSDGRATVGPHGTDPVEAAVIAADAVRRRGIERGRGRRRGRADAARSLGAHRVGDGRPSSDARRAVGRCARARAAGSLVNDRPDRFLRCCGGGARAARRTSPSARRPSTTTVSPNPGARSAGSRRRASGWPVSRANHRPPAGSCRGRGLRRGSRRGGRRGHALAAGGDGPDGGQLPGWRRRHQCARPPGRSTRAGDRRRCRRASSTPHRGLLSRNVRRGTANLAVEPAMTVADARAALDVGAEVAAFLVADGARCLITGDMGIGSSTPSAALIAAFTRLPVASVTGRGTGVDDATLARKVAVIEAAIAPRRADAGRSDRDAGRPRGPRDRRTRGIHHRWRHGTGPGAHRRRHRLCRAVRARRSSPPARFPIVLPATARRSRVRPRCSHTSASSRWWISGFVSVKAPAPAWRCRCSRRRARSCVRWRRSTRPGCPPRTLRRDTRARSSAADRPRPRRRGRAVSASRMRRSRRWRVVVVCRPLFRPGLPAAHDHVDGRRSGHRRRHRGRVAVCPGLRIPSCRRGTGCLRAQAARVPDVGVDQLRRRDDAQPPIRGRVPPAPSRRAGGRSRCRATCLSTTNASCSHGSCVNWSRLTFVSSSTRCARWWMSASACSGGTQLHRAAVALRAVEGGVADPLPVRARRAGVLRRGAGVRGTRWFRGARAGRAAGLVLRARQLLPLLPVAGCDHV